MLAYPTIKVFYNNTVKVDLDTVGTTFLRVSIDFTDSVPMGMDAIPITASYGGNHPADVCERRWRYEGCPH